MTSLIAKVDPRRLSSLAGAALLVGALAGSGAATFATVAAGPAIEEAIAIEEALAAEEAQAGPSRGAAAAEDDHDEVVISRPVQRGAGLFGAYAFTGMAFGLFLAVASFVMRASPIGPMKSVTIAGVILAGAVTLVPWLKYPPNPPAVGDPATLAKRQILYLALVLVTGALGMGAAMLSARLRAAEWTHHDRAVAVVAAVVVPMLVVLAVLPGAPDSVDVPATLVWRFRLGSLGANLLLWTALTLGLGWLVSESERRRIDSSADNATANPPAPAAVAR